jgi:hypothetical protein
LFIILKKEGIFMRKLVSSLLTVLLLFACVLSKGLIVSAIDIPVNETTFPGAT